MSKQLKIKYWASFFLIFFVLIFPPMTISAAGSTNLNYEPMETLPGFEKTANYPIFISNFYKFGIWVVGICALIMIVIGGYMYAASGGNNASMEKAKTFITDALVGLILALLAYLILYIINPELVKIKMGSADTTLPGTPGPSLPPPVLPPAEKGACQLIKSQVPSQCKDASPELNQLLQCVNGKLADKVQISSISDGNGGVNCYQNNPAWPQCSQGKQTYCCFHKKNSCHYGGTSCFGSSFAVDFSTKGSSATNTEIKQTVESCGGRAIDEGNHVHASTGNCGCT